MVCALARGKDVHAYSYYKPDEVQISAQSLSFKKNKDTCRPSQQVGQFTYPCFVAASIFLFFAFFFLWLSFARATMKFSFYSQPLHCVCMTLSQQFLH